MTPTQVNEAAAKAGINVEFSGNTADGGIISYKQSIAEGEKVDSGTVITVYFNKGAEESSEE